MNIKNYFAAILIMVVLLSACVLSSGQSPNPPTQSSTLPAVATLIPTSPPTLQPSETPVLSQEISEACVQLDLDNKSQIPLKGVPVFTNLSSDLVESIYLKDLEHLNTKLITNVGPLKNFWGISPDRKYLLYEYDTLSSEECYLAITDASGQTLKEFDNRFPNDPYSADYYNWQNDENIRVVRSFTSQESFKIFPKIYNPFTGDYWALKTDFRDYVAEELDWGLDWIAHSTGFFEGTNLVYDPSLTRVLYPKKGEIVSLTDVETGNELASIHLPNWGRLPKWSPDGKYLTLIAGPNTYIAKDEIYMVQRDGSEFKRMTYLSNTFTQSGISDLAWSPDGTRIAFWAHTDPGDPDAEGTQSELMLLDIQTGEITNLCIQGISAITHLNEVVLFASLEPVWSPDGNQIMISQ